MIELKTITAEIHEIFLNPAIELPVFSPFKSIIKWNDDIKEYWANQAQEQPPVPHAEDLTVTKFCDQLHISIEHFKEKMSKQNWKYESENEKIKDIAKHNKISPSDIFNALTTRNNSIQSKQSSGKGWGKIRLHDICIELNTEIQTTLKKLDAKGIKASKNDLIKDIANRNGLRPIDIINILNEN